MSTMQEETRVKYRSVWFMGVEVYAVYDRDQEELFFTQWDFAKEVLKKIVPEECREGWKQWMREHGPLNFYPSVHWLWDGVYWDNGNGYWEKMGEREDKAELLQRQKGFVI